MHEGNGYSPFHIMFLEDSKTSCYSIGILPKDNNSQNLAEYIRKVKKRISVTYDVAGQKCRSRHCCHVNTV